MLKHYKKILFLSILGVVIYSGVNIFYKIVGSSLEGQPIRTVPAGDLKTDVRQDRLRSEYNVIVKRDILRSGSKEGAGLPEKDETEGLEATSLDLVLLGTTTGGVHGDCAIIEEGTKKKQDIYKVGDSVGGAELKKILRKKCVITVGNNDEILIMDEEPRPGAADSGARGASREGRHISLTRSDIKKSLDNVGTLLSQARIRPHSADGKPDGFRLTRIKPGSMFNKMGLKNGDIVHSVNNKEIKSTEDIIKLYQNMNLGREIALEVTRNGNKESLNFSFE
jgi:general secretion pathway protein C